MNVITRAQWFGDPARPVVSWLTESIDAAGSSGVVILPPIGYEYWTSHRSLRLLAERLAQSGHRVLRVDYTGTGDSGGNQWDPHLLEQWSRDVLGAVERLRNAGAKTITLIGLRLGAALALQAMAQAPVDYVVAWLPIASGRRYVRELTMFSQLGPSDESNRGNPASDQSKRYIAGCVFTPDFLGDIGKLSLDDFNGPGQVLMLERPDKIAGRSLAQAWQARGVSVDYMELPGAESMLDVPTEYAQPPEQHIDAIVAWLERALPQYSDAAGAPVQCCPQEWSVRFGEHTVHERVVRLGPNKLVGIESALPGPAPDTLVVFLNTGSEPHVGPGRAWVEYCRRLATHGVRTLRLDFRGWGESPDDGFAPGRPYDLHTVDDLRDLIQALAEQGERRVVLVGLCASAWVALREIWPAPVCGVVALNPQLYWRTGDPVYATLPEANAWIRQNEHGQWDDAGRKGIARHWFEQIGRSPYRVDMWFEKNDPGLVYIRDQLQISVAAVNSSGKLSITEFDQLDHSMHRQWHREEAIDAILLTLAQLTSR